MGGEAHYFFFLPLYMKPSPRHLLCEHCLATTTRFCLVFFYCLILKLANQTQSLFNQCCVRAFEDNRYIESVTLLLSKEKPLALLSHPYGRFVGINAVIFGFPCRTTGLAVSAPQQQEDISKYSINCFYE